MNSLFQKIQNENWNKVAKIAKRSPSLAEQTLSVDGFYCDRQAKEAMQVNALQLACAHRPPVEVIRELHVANSNMISEIDKHGRLALHIAAMQGASSPTMAMLIRLFPNALKHRENHGRLALHYACQDTINSLENVRTLLKVYPQSAHVSDNSGCRPLHIACQSGNSMQVIKMLIIVT